MDVQQEDDARQARRRRLRRGGVAAGVVVALLTGAAVGNVFGVGDSVERLARGLGLSWLVAAEDSDGDGLPDHLEQDGWQTKKLGRFVTDPSTADTDGDGLTDGQEAGAVLRRTSRPDAFTGIADPTQADTDGDGVGDGDEYFFDMDLLRGDTDGDGLSDDVELDFGSDPTLDNPDDDSYSDKEERERGSDPLAYDLKKLEAVSAFAVGAAAGDWSWGAQRLGRMSDVQLQSAEYLAGSIVSGYVGAGDVRDLVVAVGDRDLLSAVSDLVDIAPGAGDVASTVEKLLKFSRKSDRGRRAAEAVLRRLPLPAAVKERAKRALTRGKGVLPSRFDVGPAENVVYKGDGYVGITKNFTQRKAQHAAAGRDFTPEKIAGADGLTRFEARAIEEACIVELGMKDAGGSLQNKRHSISPKDPDYQDALEWARAFLRKSAASCA